MSAGTATAPWTLRRRRAEELRARHAFAEELLDLYLALLAVQEQVWRTAPAPAELVRWAAANVVPAVVEATEVAGPPALREAVGGRDVGEDVLRGWLAGAALDPVDRYVARASLAPALEALGDQAGEACAVAADEEAAATCPRCAGPPQLSVVADTGEALVSGRRSLHCARCASSWDYSRSTCPACGESDEDRLLVYSEQWGGPVSANGNGARPPVFPHLRVVGCETCRRYLIEVDMARDGRAVPEVDELVALPLDLYAADQGLTKVTPNLMGF
ncbi:MAG TPA: formate dehydrogenase accessory protein FdhE [Gaiellaceae bacterium]|nr:formate dehydrogenase accessory protein FdhE [Gaiellaceae bacterium]